MNTIIIVDDNQHSLNSVVADLLKHFSDVFPEIVIRLVRNQNDAESISQALIERWDALHDNDTLVILMDYTFKVDGDLLEISGETVVETCVDAGLPLDLFIGLSSEFSQWEYKGKQIQHLPRIDILPTNDDCRSIFRNLKSKKMLLRR